MNPPYAPTVDRMALVEGAAHIIYGNAGVPPSPLYLWCDGAVNVSEIDEFLDRKAAGFGRFDSTRKDARMEVSFKPSGNLPVAALAFLFGSLGTMRQNADLYGAADVPIQVHALDGTLIGLTAAAVHELPTLLLGAANERWNGNCKIVGVLGRNLARTAPGALRTRQTGVAFTAVPSSDEYTQLPVHATWGENTIATQTGWKVSWKIGVGQRVDPNVGTFTYRLISLECEARCRPYMLDDSIWNTPYFQGASSAIGAARVGADLQLVEDAPGLSVVLKGARLETAPAAFDENNPRLGELVFRSYRDLSAGYGALFTVAHTAP